VNWLAGMIAAGIAYDLIKKATLYSLGSISTEGTSLPENHFDSLSRNYEFWYHDDRNAINMPLFSGNHKTYSCAVSFFKHPALAEHCYHDPENVQVYIKNQDYQLDKEYPQKDLLEKADDCFKNEGRYFNEEENRRLMRIAEISRQENEVCIIAQPTTYNIQAVTNLVMDMKHSDGFSWREKILKASGNKYELEPLETSKLANTLGVSILFELGDGSIVFPLRHNVAIFRNMWGATCSFACNWNNNTNNPESLMNFLKEPIRDHVFDELGFREDEYEYEPLALCREWYRGGKPQIFFKGTTSINKDELHKRLQSAQHRDEIKPARLHSISGRRVFLNCKNRKKHAWSPEAMMNLQLLRWFDEANNQTSGTF